MIASAIVVALGAPVADALIALAITFVILRITWQSWLTVRGDGHQAPPVVATPTDKPNDGDGDDASKAAAPAAPGRVNVKA